jgi:hypothetical protein
MTVSKYESLVFTSHKYVSFFSFFAIFFLVLIIRVFVLLENNVDHSLYSSCSFLRMLSI